MDWWVWILTAIVLAGVAWFFLHHFLKFGREVHAERARELFRLQKERLHELFIRAASNSGKPRGLRWRKVDWHSNVQFSRDRETDQIVAFVGITVQFEAIEGGDMDGVAAVANLRDATAVFFHEKGRWETVGRVLFNMDPQGALEHLLRQYEALPADQKPSEPTSSL